MIVWTNNVRLTFLVDVSLTGNMSSKTDIYRNWQSVFKRFGASRLRCKEQGRQFFRRTVWCKLNAIHWVLDWMVGANIQWNIKKIDKRSLLKMKALFLHYRFIRILKQKQTQKLQYDFFLPKLEVFAWHLDERTELFTGETWVATSWKFNINCCLWLFLSVRIPER